MAYSLVGEQGDSLEQAQKLQRITAALGTIQDRSEVATALLATGIDALGASGGAVGLLDDARRVIRLTATAGYPRKLTRQFREMSLDFRAPLTDAARTGEVLIFEDPEQLDASYPDVLWRRGRAADHAIIALPLEVGSGPFGAIVFTFAAPRSIGADDREFSSALANLSAQVLDRIERQRLHDRTARLQAVTAELAKAILPEDVGRVVVDEVVHVLNADAGRILIVDQRTGGSRLLAVAGYPDAVVDRALLHADGAYMDGSPVLIESLAEIDEPWAIDLHGPPVEANACAAFPLYVGQRLLGSIAFAWHDEREFTQEDISFLGALANVCAQSLERTELYAESEHTRDLLRNVLDHLGEAVLTVDADMTVSYANAEARSLFRRRVLVGRRLPGRWRDVELRRIAQAQIDLDAEPTEERVTTSEGRIFNVLAMRGGEHVILILRDVTRRERQERAQAEFIANAAHELRTPLTGIATAADALERGAKDIPAERDYFVGGIVTEVQRISRLSDALLVLARVQAQPNSLHTDVVELEAVVTDVAANLDVKPGVRVRANVDGHAIIGERNLLEGALANVARNASQHTSQGEIVFESRLEDGEVVLEVSDTGRGMDEELLSRVKARFIRGDHDENGFGLGLSIAQEMVRVLSGTLTIDRRRRRGTIVTLRLPSA